MFQLFDGGADCWQFYAKDNIIDSVFNNILTKTLDLAYICLEIHNFQSLSSKLSMTFNLRYTSP